jgi:L-aminopeptidase/D-esterase-like protein
VLAPLLEGTITDVPGIKVGHHSLTRRPTGCTVLLCEEGAVAGVDVRGSAPGTRETDLLDPTNAVQQVQAILLSGGSAYGLEAATGVMRYLEERKLGFRMRAGVVPIVPAAICLTWASATSRSAPMQKPVTRPALQPLKDR